MTSRRRSKPKYRSVEQLDRSDHVDWILAQWGRERPDLDMWSIGAFSRIKRAAEMMEEVVAGAVAPLGIQVRDFEIVGAIRRAGPPFELSPAELGAAILVSGGTITNRLDKLEGLGYVVREPNHLDRRALRIRLTDDGIALADDAVRRAVDAITRVLEPVGDEDAQMLGDLLRAVLLRLEALRLVGDLS